MNKKHTFPPILSSSWDQLHSQYLYFLLLSDAGGCRMGGVHNSLSLTLFPISLLQSVNSNMGLYQRSSNSSQTSQYRFLPWNAVLHKETSPIEWFLSRKYEVWASPFMVAQVLPGSSFRTGSPQGHSLLWVYPWAYMEGQLPHHGFHHGLQGNLLWLLEQLYPLLLHWPWFYRDISLTSSYSSVPSPFGQQFLSILNTLSQTCCHHFRCLGLGQC